jgi:hypothetical protein
MTPLLGCAALKPTCKGHYITFPVVSCTSKQDTMRSWKVPTVHFMVKDLRLKECEEAHNCVALSFHQGTLSTERLQHRICSCTGSYPWREHLSGVLGCCSAGWTCLAGLHPPAGAADRSAAAPAAAVCSGGTARLSLAEGCPALLPPHHPAWLVPHWTAAPINEGLIEPTDEFKL